MSDWRSVKIGDFLFERKGKYKPTAKEVCGLSRINKIDMSGHIHVSDKPSNTNMILIKPGDLVISGIGVAMGSLGIYEGDRDIAATIHYSSYTYDKGIIDIEFLKRFVKSPGFVRLLKQQVRGGMRPEIKARHLLPLTINLPSLREQKKIASELRLGESMVYQLSNRVNNLVGLFAGLRWRILQDAIEGKLTADWRKETSRNYESAEVLLKRISQEKERLIKAGEIAKQKSLPPVADSEKPFALPKGWAWCRLGELGLINPRNKGIKDNCTVGFSPMKLISNGYCESLRHEKKTWREVANGFTHIANDDVVVAKITPCFENGKGGVVKNFPNGVGAGTTELYVFRKIINYTCPEFIHTNFKAKGFLEAGKKLMKGTAGQQRVPRGFIENRLIAIPPLAEQRAIVAKVKKLLALCNALQMETRYAEIIAKRLMQAALKEAFTPPQG